MIEAARWIDRQENRVETAQIISGEAYINVPEEVIMLPLTGQYKYHQEMEPVNLPDFNVFYRYAATFPWHSHAAWYMSQMIRWKDIPDSLDIKNIINDIFWVNFYREIASEMELDYPLQNSKAEGRHQAGWEIESKNGSMGMAADQFIDNEQFDF